MHLACELLLGRLRAICSHWVAMTRYALSFLGLFSFLDMNQVQKLFKADDLRCILLLKALASKLLCCAPTSFESYLRMHEDDCSKTRERLCSP